jgi:hypothetical protein
MKKIVVVVADGCVETIFTNIEEDVEVEIVDFDSAFPSKDEQEELARYVDDCRLMMKEL